MPDQGLDLSRKHDTCIEIIESWGAALSSWSCYHPQGPWIELLFSLRAVPPFPPYLEPCYLRSVPETGERIMADMGIVQLVDLKPMTRAKHFGNSLD